MQQQVLHTASNGGGSVLYSVLKQEKCVPILLWSQGVSIDSGTKKQLSQLAKLPIIHSHIAVMPDAHIAIGATVGSVIPTIRAVIPAAVGVDIGCGMVAVRTSLTSSDLPTNLKDVRTAIEKAIPHGRTSGGSGDKGAWKEIPKRQENIWATELEKDFQKIVEKHPKIGRSNNISHLGTLGTGNHFVELCLDEEQRVWCMLHSGSRGVGNLLGTYFIELAKKDMKNRLYTLPHVDLAYHKEGSPNFNDYILAVNWAQKFAKINRQLMMEALLKALGSNSNIPPFTASLEAVDCHHNYVNKEVHFGQEVFVTRKGAVRAGKGEMGIIPGSMGAKSFIVRGLGNSASFESCSHGAGRTMSRGEAKTKFSIADHVKATEGVECRKDEHVIDETPMAYKDIEAVMNAQKDLVEIVHTLKQIVCVKG